MGLPRLSFLLFLFSVFPVMKSPDLFGAGEEVNKILKEPWLLKMEDQTNSNSESDSKPQVVYRCRKCRKIVASHEHVVTHEPGGGQECFKWKKRSNGGPDQEKPACSSVFVEPLKWMQALEDGGVEDRLLCLCKARLGSFNWAGMQCSCGKWITPAFQLHKNRIDECFLS